MTHARPAGDRGAGVLAYLSLGVLAAVILAGLVTLGVGDRFSAGAAAVVCRTVQVRGDCAAPAGDDRPSAGDTGGKSGGGNDGGKKSGGCHGFLGCTWSGAKHVGGGVWGGIKDTGSGVKSVFTTNPLTTAKGLGTFLWNETPPGQVVRAWKACGAGRYAECADAGFCAVLSGGCLVRDMVIDDKTRDDLEKHRWGDAAGRVIWNGGSLFIPTKIPGLSRLGKAGKVAEDAGDAARGAKPGRVAAPPGENSTLSLGRAEKQLRSARRARGDAEHLMFPAVKDLAADFERLGPAERTAFLDRFALSEMADLWAAAPGIDKNLRSDLKQAASPSVLRFLDHRPPFADLDSWYHFTGDLWRETGPKLWDVEQGKVGDCWCMASMGALADRSPETLEHMFTKNANGTYTVAFGDGTRETISAEIPRSAAHVYDNAGWPALLEKAIAARQGGYDVIGHGGDAGVALHWLTGRPVAQFMTKDHSMLDAQAISTSLADHDAMVLTIDEGTTLPGMTDRGIVDNHAYTVTDADPAAGTVTLANPHGPTAPEITLSRRELMETDGLTLYRVPTK